LPICSERNAAGSQLDAAAGKNRRPQTESTTPSTPTSASKSEVFVRAGRCSASLAQGNPCSQFTKWRDLDWENISICKTGRTTLQNKLDVSQEEFAHLCGLDRTYVGGVERGERNLSLINIEKLARALKLSISELFRGV
jgi:DNA-binding XRE family transcriptional regulator